MIAEKLPKIFDIHFLHENNLSNRCKLLEKIHHKFIDPEKLQVLRFDGRSFHTLTRKLKCKKPFDLEFIQCMRSTLDSISSNIHGFRIGYTQSDEITIVIDGRHLIDPTNYEFAGRIDKLLTTWSSMVTAYFIENLYKTDIAKEYLKENSSLIPTFDCRIMDCTEIEVHNVILWRFLDCVKNSISMIVQSQFSHNQLLNINRLGQMKMYQDKMNSNLIEDYADQIYGYFITRSPIVKINDDGEEYTRTIIERLDTDLIVDIDDFQKLIVQKPKLQSKII